MRKLIVGDKAPDIRALDVSGDLARLSTKGYTLVTFLRYAGCQLCNMALQRLTLEHKLLKKNNCDVIAFVQSTATNVDENIYRRHETKPQFPIVPDQEGDWYSIYGVDTGAKTLPKALLNLPAWLKSVQQSSFKSGKVDGNLFLVPALFIVDVDGIVRYADYDANFYTHEHFTPIYELLTFGS